MIVAVDQEPRWLQVLRAECEKTSQRKVAADIGYSAAAVSRVLNNKYGQDGGRLDRFEHAVRGAYMGETVNCPILGELPVNRCLENQRRPFAATNPTRVQLYRACRGCAHNQQEK